MDALMIFSNVITVKGHTKSTICDLQNNRFEIIPNSFADFIKLYNRKKIKDIHNQNKKNVKVITEYINFITENEFGIILNYNDLKNFPEINFQWKTPNYITNIIIDLTDKYSNKDLSELESIINQLFVTAIQIRVYKIESCSSKLLISLLKKINKSRIRHLDILIPNNFYEIEELMQLCIDFQTISYIMVHGCSEDLVLKTEKNDVNIFMFKKSVQSESCCGIVHPKFFNINIQSYSEGLVYNTCLNKKLSFDGEKNIKNCPAMNYSFGTLGEKNDYFNIIGLDEFQKYWRINKANIESCKICEFRAVCTDCRAFVEGDEYSKPSKCNYDPFLGEWLNKY